MQASDTKTGPRTGQAPRRSAWRIAWRAARWAAVVLACLVAFVWLWGTTAAVTPPQAPADPVAVLVIADDRHRGLVLPDPAGGYVEFGFGSWGFYALGEDAWYQAAATALWPSPATLSRRKITAADPAGVRSELSWATFQEVRVPREAARALVGKLEAAYAERKADERARRGWRMTFVPHAGSYWLLNTCADVVAEWLRELGCRVSWVPICLDLQVR